ncbi:MAG: GNAT family N-acetyltransferase [Candidatus Jordarchaeum sp.]|uniref:GNAT family N-acetyltransferase n=1 Tax=Candidatus Jordarchaeum sp. TaxID=2823881 RepID=UPI00404B7A85
MSDILIRDYRFEDGDEVEELFRFHTGKHLRKATFLFYKKELDGKPSDNVIAVVSVVNNRVIGFSGVQLVSDTEIKYPATIVHSDFRNRGIGKMLMRKKLEIARAKGLKEYNSIVGEENIASRRMLESLGDFKIYEQGEYDKNKKWIKYKTKLT